MEPNEAVALKGVSLRVSQTFYFPFFFAQSGQSFPCEPPCGAPHFVQKYVGDFLDMTFGHFSSHTNSENYRTNERPYLQ